MAEPATIRLELDGPIATVTLNRPERLNALGPPEWDQLAEIWERCRKEPQIRCVILTGEGRAFCAGGDVKSAGDRLSEPPSLRFHAIRQMNRTVRAMREVPHPIIAAVNGPCFGAGLSLALACDLRICAESATFGAAFSKIGFAIDIAGSYLLPQVIGTARAMEFHLLAEPVAAPRALEIGLVSRVVSDADLPDEAERLADTFAEGPPLSLGFIKNQIYRGAELPLDALIEYEAALQALCLSSDDAKEGVKARNEKRKPHFKGR